MHDKMYNNIAALVKRRGIKMGEFESSIGVSAGYVSRLKNNNSSPTVDFVIKISDYLEVSIDALLNYDMNSSTNNLDYLSDFVNRLIKDTDSRKLVWKRCDPIDIKTNGASFFGRLFQRPIIGQRERDVSDYENFDFNFDPYIYGDEYEYHSLFNTCIDPDSIKTSYRGQSVSGMNFYLINFTKADVDGWELYIDPDTDIPMEGYTLQGIYTTVDSVTDKLLPVTKDLVQCIKKNLEDAKISISLRNMLDDYLNGGKEN